jgi:hypothetical protein
VQLGWWEQRWGSGHGHVRTEWHALAAEAVHGEERESLRICVRPLLHALEAGCDCSTVGKRPGDLPVDARYPTGRDRFPQAARQGTDERGDLGLCCGDGDRVLRCTFRQDNPALQGESAGSAAGYSGVQEPVRRRRQSKRWLDAATPALDFKSAHPHNDQVVRPPEPKYDLNVGLPRNRLWIMSAGAAVIAVLLFGVGLYLWRMMVPTRCGPAELCLGHLPQHHLHQVRAEGVWLASGVFAFIAAASALWPDPFRHRVRPGSIEDSSGQSGTIPGQSATGGRPVGL